MRFSKPEEGRGGRREERRRARERAREARKRRQELERRAAQLQTKGSRDEAPATEKKPRPTERQLGPTKKQKPEPEAKKKPDAGQKKAGTSAKEPRGSTKKKAVATKERIADREKPAAKGPTLRELPGELSRRLSLARLGSLLAPAGRELSRVARLAAVVILKAAGSAEWLIVRLIRSVGAPAANVANALGRLVTPTRAAIAISIAAGLAVLVAQVMDYRAVAIGEDAYAEVASLAQAPLADHRTPWSVHGPLVGLLAIAAAVGAIAVLRGAGRRALLGALGASGAGLLVILGLDLTRAGDVGQAAAEYAGTDAVLLEGFYIQLCAMLLLGLVALLPSLWKRKVG